MNETFRFFLFILCVSTLYALLGDVGVESLLESDTRKRLSCIFDLTKTECSQEVKDGGGVDQASLMRNGGLGDSCLDQTPNRFLST